MKKKYLIFSFFLLTLCNSTLFFCQSNEIKISFIGNCALNMTDGISNIYIDFPYKSGAHKYMKYENSELENVKNNSIFIFTHKHNDHYSEKLLKKYQGQKYGPWNINELDKIKESIPDFEIQPFKTSHKVYGISFEHYSYLITWHNKKIYLSGDTGELEDLSKIKNIDYAFINPWMFMTSRREKISIDAKFFGIYHLYPDQHIDDGFPDNIKFLKQQGEVIHIPF